MLFFNLFLIGGFPHSSVGKESACSARDPSSIPGVGRSAGEGIGYPLQYSWASLMAQLVKNPPAVLETWVWSLGWEDPLEKGKATHSSILAWRIPWTVFHGVTKSQTWLSDFHLHLCFPHSSVGKESACNAGDPGSIPWLGRSTGEGIGYPLQYSWASLVAQLIENPPAMWESWVQSLGWEDPLEKG